MLGIRTLKRAEVSATELPEMPPNIMLATTLTSARPPRIGRRIMRQKSISLLDKPPEFISSPAKMNSGRAMMMKPLVPDQMRCGRLTRKAGCSRKKYRRLEAPMAKASGMPTARAVIRAPTIRKRLIGRLRRGVPSVTRLRPPRRNQNRRARRLRHSPCRPRGPVRTGPRYRGSNRKRPGRMRGGP